MIPGSVRGGIVLFLAVVGCIGNLFVILIVLTKRRLHTMLFFLLANLSLSDFLLHIFSIFLAISHISEKWLFGITWCKGNHYVLQCLLYTTILLLCAVTWDCHTAVVTPYDYSRDITVRKIIIVVVLWIASFVFGAATLFGLEELVYNDKLYKCESDFKSNDLSKTLFTVVLFLIIPFGLIAKQQYQINRIVKRQRAQIAQQHLDINFNSPDGQKHRRLFENLRKSKDALIIVVAFVVSYLPICVTMVLRKRLPESEELNDAWVLVSILCQLGATWNPIIYCYRKRQFRRQLFKFFGVDSFRRVAPEVIPEYRNGKILLTVLRYN